MFTIKIQLNPPKSMQYVLYKDSGIVQIKGNYICNIFAILVI